MRTFTCRSTFLYAKTDLYSGRYMAKQQHHLSQMSHLQLLILWPISRSTVSCDQWGGRLEGWPNMASRLAGWGRVILYVMDGPFCLLWQITPLVPVWDWSISECTQSTVMSYVTQGRPGTLLDPCLLSNCDNMRLKTAGSCALLLLFPSCVCSLMGVWTMGTHTRTLHQAPVSQACAVESFPTYSSLCIKQSWRKHTEEQNNGYVVFKLKTYGSAGK